MTLILKQVRICDGKCCEESPRFPNRDHLDCLYHIKSRGKENTGCTLMSNPDNIPDSICPATGTPARDALKETCINWPQNSPIGRSTGGCCWQWVDG